MHSASITCFGVGDGWPCHDRFHSAFLYRLGGATILVDCGEPVVRGLKSTGVEIDQLDRVLLSHLHCDHLGGFFMLAQGAWLEPRTRALPVHMPRHAVEPVRQVLRAACIFDELFRQPLPFEPLVAGQPIVTGALTITPFPTTHLKGLETTHGARYPGVYDAFAFLLEGPGYRVAHSADIGAVEDLEPLLRQPVDMLVCELAHVEPERLFRYLRTRSIQQIVFVHLARDWWAQLDAMQARAAAELGEVPFRFARDGEVIPLL